MAKKASVNGSPLAKTSKYSSQRCASPGSDRRGWLFSPADSFVTVTSSAKLSQPKYINTELYFRLLKKAHVLDQLLELSSHVESQEEQLRHLESERVKNSSVNEFVFQELDEYKRKFLEAQKLMLEVVEAMTTVCIKEEELQRGTSSREAFEIAKKSTEERVLRDLGATIPLSSKASNGEESMESRALLDVGIKRVQQFESICASYERQIMNIETELSQALNATFRDECLAKIADYQRTIDRLEAEKNELQVRVDGLKDQKTELQRINTSQHDELLLEQQFTTDLKAELRKRYGLVPSVVDQRWREYFPDLEPPQ
ncbi:hypothetical protein Poli38472_008596 [Pythium oligandrum]|uniref:Uncharacterized protein n=1 Tax=Pythium oligandrum TaxID=41045 RepID=A0A8K1FEK4_PYTOL|nr:hypothetical protein Poli38472_008596 [Pythium oligandrum]|eukprot:TMW55948.1 hypothetical protein Poli38472_008596 [Pythium oligandrum]